MDYIDLNTHLKAMITDLVELGYKKTVIGKLLLGSSGYALMLKYLDENSEENTKFGVKPLTKVATTIEYDLHLVFVKKENIDVINEIESMNNTFLDELKVALINFMNSNGDGSRKPYTSSKKRKNDFENVLNDILSTDIFGSNDTVIKQITEEVSNELDDYIDEE